MPDEKFFHVTIKFLHGDTLNIGPVMLLIDKPTATVWANADNSIQWNVDQTNVLYTRVEDV